MQINILQGTKAWCY